MLHRMDNKPLSGNILSQAVRSLEARLPQGWLVAQRSRGALRNSRPGTVLELRAPDGEAARFDVEVKNRLEPRDVEGLGPAREGRKDPSCSLSSLVVTPFLTSRTRDLLTEAGFLYLDLTGNCRIVSTSPGLFISTQGEEKNPWPEERTIRSLKGSVVGRIVRALCDYSPPVGVRELAARSAADAGYVSRILDLLHREALIVRRPHGAVTEVRWKDLIRRWTRDYSPLAKDRAFSYLEPRGLSAFVDKLKGFNGRYALTGSLAAAWVAPIAPPRLVTCYVDDPEAAASALHLCPAEAAINVMLLLPFDAVVYERTWSHQGVVCASPSQVAADLLRSPGRGPQEADALFDYMAKEEHVWRT